MTIAGGAWGHRDAAPRRKAEADRQQIAAFDPKAFVYSSRGRLVLPLRGHRGSPGSHGITIQGFLG